MNFKKGSIAIFLFFYLGWFGCIFLARAGLSHLSLILPLLLTILLLVLKKLKPKPLALALVLAFVGVLFDIAMIQLELIKTTENSPIIIPVWLISIWLLFTLSTVELGSSIRISTWLAGALGLVFGPLSYKSGEIFEVLTFSSSLTFLIYGLFWLFLFPVILTLSKRFV